MVDTNKKAFGFFASAPALAVRFFMQIGTRFYQKGDMSKYGLRSWSGPFDWLVTESLEWVLHFIEKDFEDFLEKRI